MDPEKKLGIILIVVGLLIPLAALPLVSGFSKDKGFYGNFYNVGIKITEEERGSVPVEPPVNADGSTRKFKVTWSQLIPQKIPYRLFFVPTVLLIYMGIIRIDRVRRKNRNQ